MHRAASYQVLAQALQSWSELPLNELIAKVGLPAEAQLAKIAAEQVTVELLAQWASSKRDAVQIVATAFGPSSWHTHRFQETATVPLGFAGKGRPPASKAGVA